MNFKHGMCGTPTWTSWKAMLRRCDGKNGKAKWYSDRGISVCAEWRDFNAFYADMGERPAGTSIDRIDNEKGYSKENCRWADRVTQAGNKRTSVILEFNGKRQCLNQWAKELGFCHETLRKRIRAGFPIEKVLSAKKFHERKGWYGDSERHQNLRKGT